MRPFWGSCWLVVSGQVSTVCVLLVRCVKPSLVSTGDEADDTENSIVVALRGGYD